MGNIFVRKATDVKPTAKKWVEEQIGRELHDQDQVAVIVIPAERVLPDSDQQEAWDRLEQIMDAMAHKAKGVNGEELELLIDEAVANVRSERD